jgi:hypothetical protein
MKVKKKELKFDNLTENLAESVILSLKIKYEFLRNDELFEIVEQYDFMSWNAGYYSILDPLNLIISENPLNSFQTHSKIRFNLFD